MQTMIDLAMPSIHTSGGLACMIGSTLACRFEVAEFFVSWQGVLTLAFTGFPDALLELKTQVEEFYPGVMKEFPGSKWPKVSIGCLRDNKRLSRLDLERLRDICSEENSYLISTTPPVEVDKLSIVLFSNCCLEQTLMTTDVTLALPADLRPPNSEHRASVRSVLDEFRRENLDNYYFNASKDGNRSAHYRGFKAGVTLVHFLTSIPRAIARFRERVERELPNMYDWFADRALHITVRAIL
ncbi:uncharacterized protein [Physcomitrium patens]|uniref:Uncharacterized protein n=1 Tax=Physcomitrium patens TaxID=3218 RepID=A9TLG7_PHYPA|nr:uncharacterized protein LOC112292030 [Physcomitrium patens]XP_024395882.1 uncharacterized protein LOC112292030 [Physcomitrium patens]XP_024395883.1 uncharacterized protein LOC112292030 [Physcomitrium patens]XP_024395884.1 uncharacterized protein LOC112292030 [Physcomitrium patens]PNR39388.1 hypothetical protein PHYPA_019666 [Physcomitrium patens]|eukprot:XP_024395881.1 uncharacterized protein LOC112292030 [Physcomitrella patens]